MKRLHLFTALLLLAALALAGGVGCAGKKDRKTKSRDPHFRYANLSNEALYERGLHALKKNRLTRAREMFEALLARPTDAHYTPLAQLRIADTHYMSKGEDAYIEAGHQYRKFLRQYPRHEEGAYVQYQVGMCFFRRILSPERDPVNTHRAMEAFEKVVKLHPESIHATSARERIELCRRNLAEREFVIGKFYYRSLRHQAALDRFERMREKYPDIVVGEGHGAEFAYYMGETLWALDRKEEGREYLRRVVEIHSHTPYAKVARARLAGKPNRQSLWDRILPPYL